MNRAAAPCLLWIAVVAAAQTPAYDPQKTFAPLTLPDPVNSYRSANGVLAELGRLRDPREARHGGEDLERDRDDHIHQQ
jgi:hypothetical protein